MNTPHITAILAITALSFRTGAMAGDAKDACIADTANPHGQQYGLRRSFFAPDNLHGDQNEDD